MDKLELFRWYKGTAGLLKDKYFFLWDDRRPFVYYFISWEDTPSHTSEWNKNDVGFLYAQPWDEPSELKSFAKQRLFRMIFEIWDWNK
jgi:hypothetical protein